MSVRDWFEIICPDFDSSILVDERYGQDEARTIFLLHQRPANTLHRSGFDADPFADHKIEVRLHSLPTEIGTQERNFCFGNRQWALTIAYNPERPWRSKNGASVCRADPHEYIRGEQGSNDIDTLTILPHMNAFVGGEKRFNLPGVQVPNHRLFTLRHGVQSKPLWTFVMTNVKRRYGGTQIVSMRPDIHPFLPSPEPAMK
jgi:hypothetical protein